MNAPGRQYHETPLFAFVRGHRGLPPTEPLAVEAALALASLDPVLDVRKFYRKPVLPRVARVLLRLLNHTPLERYPLPPE